MAWRSRGEVRRDPDRRGARLRARLVPLRRGLLRGRGGGRPADRRRRGPEPLRPQPRSFTWKAVGVNAAGPSAAAGPQLPQHQADPGIRLAGGPVAGPGRRRRPRRTSASCRGGRRGRGRCRPTGAAPRSPRSTPRSPGWWPSSRRRGWPSGTSPCCTRAGSGTGSTPVAVAAAVGRGLLGLQRGGPGRWGAVRWQRPGRPAADDPLGQGAGVPGGDLSAWTSCPTLGRDEVRDANLLYVGLTRAMDHLAVTWAGRSDLTHRIEASGKARPSAPAG